MQQQLTEVAIDLSRFFQDRQGFWHNIEYEASINSTAFQEFWEINREQFEGHRITDSDSDSDGIPLPWDELGYDDTYSDSTLSVGNIPEGYVIYHDDTSGPWYITYYMLPDVYYNIVYEQSSLVSRAA